MTTLHALRRDVRAHAWDVAVAAGTVAIAVLVLITRIDVQDVDAYRFRADAWWGWAATIAACAALAGRRRWPLPTLGVALLLTVPLELTHHRDTVVFFADVLAVCGVAAYVPLRRALWAFPMVAALYATTALAGAMVITSAPLVGPLFLTTAFAVGCLLRLGRLRQDRDLQAAVERAAELVVSADLLATGERLRLAQELHDVVAHSLSVIAVQAGIGAHLVEREPAEAALALDAIRATSRTAAGEIARLVDTLRDGANTDLTPAPTLGGLDSLVAQIRAAGVAVTSTVHGDPHEVPAGVSLAAYRIVQEALTNVVRHAGRAQATVTVRIVDERVELRVDDDGHGHLARHAHATGREPADGHGDGHGLTGMRERAALYGGEMRTGPRPGGGFRVDATVPFDAGPARRGEVLTVDDDALVTATGISSRPRITPLTWDVVLAAAMVALTAAETIGAGPTTVPYRPTDAWAWALRVGCCLVLATRRRFPIATLGAVWVLALPLTVADYKVGFVTFALWIAVYSVASRRSIGQLTAAMVGTYAGIAAIAWSRPPDLTTPGAVWIAVLFTATAVAGGAVRQDRERRALDRAGREAAADVHAQRALLMIATERLRIADELGAIIRRSIDTIAREAGAGSQTVALDPAAARRTLEAISTTSREALADVRRLLHRMRAESEPLAYAPVAAAPAVGTADVPPPNSNAVTSAGAGR